MKNARLKTWNVQYFLPVFIVLFGLIFVGNLPAQDKDTKDTAQDDAKHDPILENVTVTNVEVPVRVLYKGKPVDNLKQEDFAVYEGKNKVKINGFYLKRKRIDVFGSPVNTGGPGKVKKKRGRTFVLVFNITDFNDSFKQALKYAFDNMLKKGDRILVFANDVSFEYKSLDDMEKVKARLHEALKKESRKARMRLSKYINRVETELNLNDFRALIHRRDDRPRRLIQFLKRYLIVWDRYKKQYLTPRTDRFYYFSRFLENIKGEKWVLSFYQFEMFPNIRINSRTMEIIRSMANSMINEGNMTQRALGKMIRTLLNRILIELNVNSHFNEEEISKLFYKADATFHSFFIKSMSKVMLNDFEYQEVSSGIENLLKNITRTTGGKNITSNNVAKSLDTVSKKVDIYYMITYAPQDPKHVGRIKVKVKKRGYKVLYDDNIRADYINDYFKKLEEKIKIPEIKIKDFSYNRSVLAFTIWDFLMRDIEENHVGKIQVRVRVTDKANNSLFDSQRVLTAKKAKFDISLKPFNSKRKLERGEYHFLIDAKDLLTGKEVNFHRNVEVKRTVQ